MAVGAQRYTSFDEIGDEWDELADRAGVSPFHRPGWNRAWWEAFGSGNLEIHALRRDGELTAVVPLVRRAGGLHAPVNWHTPEFGATAANADAARALYAAILASRPAYTSLRFLDDSDAVPPDALREAGYATTVRTLQESPYLPLVPWDELPQPRPKEMAKRWRKLDELGGVKLDVREGTDELEEGFRIEGSGWKTEQGTAILSHEDTRRFYTDVAHWAAGRGILRLFFLRVGGRAVAFQLGLEDVGSYYFVKGGFDTEFRKHAPGLVLISEIMRWSCDRGLDTFEFLGAPDPQKLEWTQLVRTRVAVEAFAPGPKGAAVRAAFALRPAARRVVELARRR